MRSRREYPFILAGLAAALAWCTIWSWSPLVSEPDRFVEPAFIGAGVIAATGALLRSLRTAWWLVLPAQLVAVTVWLHHRQHADTVFGGWVPTPDGLALLADQVRAGAAQINKYAAPLEAEHVEAPVYLLLTALVVALVVDLIGCGLHRAPWAGLPVLVALTVPISVLDTPVPWPVLFTAALLYLATIAYAESEEVAGWGQGTTPVRRDDLPPGRFVGAGPAAAIGLVTTLSALILPALVPVSAGVLKGDTGTTGGGGSGTITLTNPLVNLRRDLERDERVPLLDAITDARDPSYLRLTVLNRFDGSSWTPSSRQLPEENRADGRLPDPEGITSTTPGVESAWSLTTSETFYTSWLPTPVPIRSIKIDKGDWRYDSSTLDIANTDRFAPSGVSYSLTGFAPTIDAAVLDAAGPPPTGLRNLMTDVPDLDPSVTEIARRVTAGGETAYDKAVLLQNWFRNDGGFEYSLDPASGSGMGQLVRFLTTDKIGYCEQFAAAMAVMARTLDIPARVVVGFLQPGQISTGLFRYTSSDLHAWPEIYFRGSGWVRFEPTPSARTGTPPPWTRDGVQAPVAPTPTASPTQSVPTPTAAPRQQTDSTEVADSSSPAPLAIGVLVIAVTGLLLVLPGLVRRSRRRRRLRVQADGCAEIEDLWSELRATALDVGIRWPDGRSVRAIARALGSVTDPTRADIGLLDALVGLVERARYGRAFVLDEQDRAVARSALERWSTLLAGAVPRRRARSARWFPRSVFQRAGPDAPVGTTSADDARDLTEVG